jgi:Zn-dependent protease
MSVVVHEVSHGFAALMQGDKTAEYQGRLTLNPIKHLDLFGSILLPLFLAVTNAGFIIGWAKPVPFNPYNLRNQKWGESIVAVAGPLSNLILAIVFGLVIRFGYGYLSISFLSIAMVVVIINLVLAVFNLVPIPPLDGSKILFSLLPSRFNFIRQNFEKYSLVILLVFIFFLWQYIIPLVYWLSALITGVSG